LPVGERKPRSDLIELDHVSGAAGQDCIRKVEVLEYPELAWKRHGGSR
jgi:hypothetical protein